MVTKKQVEELLWEQIIRRDIINDYEYTPLSVICGAALSLHIEPRLWTGPEYTLRTSLNGRTNVRYITKDVYELLKEYYGKQTVS